MDAVTLPPLQLAQVLEDEADDIQARCIAHSPKGATGTTWLDCHCAVAHHLRRKATAARNAA
jgi:hypothetical protein